MTAPERDRIVQVPKTLCDKATIRGTRISVAMMLDKMAWGGTIENILASYPHVQREDGHKLSGNHDASLLTVELLLRLNFDSLKFLAAI